VLTRGQKLRYALYLLLFAAVILWDCRSAGRALSLAVCVFYAAAVGYKLLIVLFSLVRNPELRFSAAELAALGERELPVYTVLVPLYREANVIPGIASALRGLDYPPEKLDVKILLEEDDAETTAACRRTRLPAPCELVVVPRGSPRTKPRACNYGLERARGRYLVIYDAEDRPERDQLRKSVAAFARAAANVACLQAKLNYYNADQNHLTRFFAVEYACWFDLFLPGLNALEVPMPLGGTSNHFRTEVLRELGGWDPFNVTEDCDLGIRLARRGFRTLVLDSTTWEEAPSHLWNWVRQRSRWVKGYLQTHLVHTRRPLRTLRSLGLRGTGSFLLTVGGLCATLLLNPVCWLLLPLWGTGPGGALFAGGLRPSVLASPPVTGLLLLCSLLLFAANLVFVLLNVLACFRRNLERLLPYALLSPLYWALISLAAWKGFAQLLRRPFYWEKTEHGQAPESAAGGLAETVPATRARPSAACARGAAPAGPAN